MENATREIKVIYMPGGGKSRKEGTIKVDESAPPEGTSYR